MILGAIPRTIEQYNYAVTGPNSGTLLPDGTFINRHFKAYEYEYFLQDSWRVTPKLTVIYGIRHSILQAPYETKGQQIAPISIPMRGSPSARKMLLRVFPSIKTQRQSEFRAQRQGQRPSWFLVQAEGQLRSAPLRGLCAQPQNHHPRRRRYVL